MQTARLRMIVHLKKVNSYFLLNWYLTVEHMCKLMSRNLLTKSWVDIRRTGIAGVFNSKNANVFPIFLWKNTCNIKDNSPFWPWDSARSPGDSCLVIGASSTSVKINWRCIGRWDTLNITFEARWSVWVHSHWNQSGYSCQESRPKIRKNFKWYTQF